MYTKSGASPSLIVHQSSTLPAELGSQQTYSHWSLHGSKHIVTFAKQGIYGWKSQSRDVFFEMVSVLIIPPADCTIDVNLPRYRHMVFYVRTTKNNIWLLKLRKYGLPVPFSPWISPKSSYTDLTLYVPRWFIKVVTKLLPLNLAIFSDNCVHINIGEYIFCSFTLSVDNFVCCSPRYLSIAF